MKTTKSNKCWICGRKVRSSYRDANGSYYCFEHRKQIKEKIEDTKEWKKRKAVIDETAKRFGI